MLTTEQENVDCTEQWNVDNWTGKCWLYWTVKCWQLNSKMLTVLNSEMLTTEQQNVDCTEQWNVDNWTAKCWMLDGWTLSGFSSGQATLEPYRNLKNNLSIHKVQNLVPRDYYKHIHMHTQQKRRGNQWWGVWCKEFGGWEYQKQSGKYRRVCVKLKTINEIRHSSAHDIFTAESVYLELNSLLD